MIAFYEGGAGGYFVRRTGGVLSIVDWSLGDGACPDKHGNLGVCPRSEKVKFQLHSPAAAKIHEHIVEVDDAGTRHAFACT